MYFPKPHFESLLFPLLCLLEDWEMKLKAAEKSNKKLYVKIIKSLKKTLKMNKYM